MQLDPTKFQWRSATRDDLFELFNANAIIYKDGELPGFEELAEAIDNGICMMMFYEDRLVGNYQLILDEDGWYVIDGTALDRTLNRSLATRVLYDHIYATCQGKNVKAISKRPMIGRHVYNMGFRADPEPLMIDGIAHVVWRRPA